VDTIRPPYWDSSPGGRRAVGPRVCLRSFGAIFWIQIQMNRLQVPKELTVPRGRKLYRADSKFPSSPAS
jgi:hypothetical protein